MKRSNLYRLALVAWLACTATWLLTDTNLALYYSCFCAGVVLAALIVDTEVTA